MKAQFRFVLIGCGRIGRKHAELLSSNKISDAELVAVCDIATEKVDKFADWLGLPGFIDAKQMLSVVDCDAIVIATESGNHASLVINLASYGKTFLVEKPMALRLSEAKEMISVCQQYNCRLFVVKQNRYNLPVVLARRAVSANALGPLFLGTVRVRWSRSQDYYSEGDWRGTWANDGGVLTNQASHHIDLLEWFLGDVESVTGLAGTYGVNIEAEDTAVVALKFKSGALGLIEATTATRPADLEGSLSILGERGTIEIAGFAVNQMKVWNVPDMIGGDLESMSENPPDVYGFGHVRYYEDMILSLKTGAAGLVEGEEGLKSLRLIHAIYCAIESGKTVFLSDDREFKRLGYDA